MRRRWQLGLYAAVVFALIYLLVKVPGSPYDRLWQAIRSKNDFLVRLALLTGSDPNGCDSSHAFVYATDPIPPVAVAIGYSPSALNMLLESGADPNVMFGDGGVPLETALHFDDQESLLALLKHGADPLAVVGGTTVLAIAMAQGKSQATDAMIQALNRRDPNWRSLNGREYPRFCPQAVRVNESGG